MRKDTIDTRHTPHHRSAAHRGRQGALLFALLVLLVALIAPQGAAVSAGGAYRYAASMAPDQVASDRDLRGLYYPEWRQKYVTNELAGGRLLPAGQLRVRRPDPENIRNGVGVTDSTVSEGIAYGMLLAAYLDDRSTFDGLWAYARQRFTPTDMMHWFFSQDDVPLDNENRPLSQTDRSQWTTATDAEEDMALALIVADKRWGGYRTAATELLAAMLTHEVEAGTDVLKPSDNRYWGGSAVTNPSYFAPAYFKVFAAYTGQDRWIAVANTSYQIIDRVNGKTGAGTTGLQPDWASAAGDPAPGMSYDYRYDAARVPWRLAMDAAWYGDARARAQLDRLNRFFQEVGPRNIKDGYQLNGAVLGTSHNAAFVATAASGAIIATDPDYRRAMWDETLATSNGVYYHDSLRVLGLLFMSGNMPHPLDIGAPPASPTTPATVVVEDFENGDGKWTSFSGGGSSIARRAISPGAVGSYAMQVDYAIAGGGWGGVALDFASPQDWGAFSALEFRLYGTGSGNTIRVELSDNRAPGSTGDTSERFVSYIKDDFTGWRSFSLPWSSFARRTDWQPTGAPNDGLTLIQVHGLNLAPVGGSGRFHLDQVQLVR